MAFRPNHLVVLAVALIGLGTVGVATYRYLGHRPEARSIPQAQVFDRSVLYDDLSTAGFRLGAPAHVRIFKREKRLELWLARDDGRYAMFKGYDICNYSGALGPKLQEGDRQAPEGFYRVGLRQLNPGSRHHLSFNLGFPNAFDTQLGRTGSALMVHGGCSSVGCYAITDESVDEVYAVVEASLRQGQQAVDVAVFPFRMTTTALADHASSPWLGFWRNLKQGYDLFEADFTPPKVGACKGEYRFGQAAEDAQCAAIAAWS